MRLEYGQGPKNHPSFFPIFDTFRPTGHEFTSRGLATRGLAAHGLAARGLATRGLAARGLAAQGLAARGLAARGANQTSWNLDTPWIPHKIRRRHGYAPRRVFEPGASLKKAA
jgi:hypothetical protein